MGWRRRRGGDECRQNRGSRRLRGSEERRRNTGWRRQRRRDMREWRLRGGDGRRDAPPSFFSGRLTFLILDPVVKRYHGQVALEEAGSLHVRGGRRAA